MRHLAVPPKRGARAALAFFSIFSYCVAVEIPRGAATTRFQGTPQAASSRIAMGALSQTAGPHPGRNPSPAPTVSAKWTSGSSPSPMSALPRRPACRPGPRPSASAWPAPATAIAQGRGAAHRWRPASRRGRRRPPARRCRRSSRRSPADPRRHVRFAVMACVADADADKESNVARPRAMKSTVSDHLTVRRRRRVTFGSPPANQPHFSVSGQAMPACSLTANSSRRYTGHIRSVQTRSADSNGPMRRLRQHGAEMQRGEEEQREAGYDLPVPERRVLVAHAGHVTAEGAQARRSSPGTS